MNVKTTFLRLTSQTVPHGKEATVLKYLPKNIKSDRFGNYYLQIGKSRTIFTSHLDTVCSGTSTKVKHVIEGYMIKTDGTTTLGADDKAGVTVMLYMIEKKVPGLYYFFVGEEVGCVGSSKAAKDTRRFNKDKWDRMVSFDRRDTCSVITYQSGQRCCSEEFATELAKRLSTNGLNLRPDNTGVYTDSAKFMPIIPECTNISVGYYSEHSSSERQNIQFLEQLCESVCKVNWETLPTRRDPSKTEYRTYGNPYGGYYGGGYDDDFYEEEYGHSVMNSRYYEEQRKIKERNERNQNRSIDLRERDFFRDDELDSVLPRNSRIEPFTENDFLMELENEEEGNIYLDNFDTPINIRNKTRYFETIKDKYLDDKLTDDEIDIIIEQILDLDDPRDFQFSKELAELRIQKRF